MLTVSAIGLIPRLNINVFSHLQHCPSDVMSHDCSQGGNLFHTAALLSDDDDAVVG